MQNLSVFLKAINQLADGSAPAEFAQDVLNYAKHIAITDSPADQKLRLNSIFEEGIGQDFVNFCVQNVPEFTEKIQKYISQYAAS